MIERYTLVGDHKTGMNQDRNGEWTKSAETEKLEALVLQAIPLMTIPSPQRFDEWVQVRDKWRELAFELLGDVVKEVENG